ncbi:MAG: zinc ribbon domain-containing protein [Gemmatimonadota bacterium]
MTTPLDGLLVLQEIDVRIAELENRNAEIPRRRSEVSRDITALENERSALADGVERGRLDRRALETDLEAEQGRRARYETQLNEVKTNVAYSALLTEIQTAKRTIGELEGQILDLMTTREDSERRIGEIDAELEVKRAAAAAALEELEREAAEVGRALEADRIRREAALTGVDKRLLMLYDRLRKVRRFPALVPLRGQACGACHNRMPPQVVQEIRHSGSLHVCEACGVLVYAESEAPAEARSEA